LVMAEPFCKTYVYQLNCARGWPRHQSIMNLQSDVSRSRRCLRQARGVPDPAHWPQLGWLTRYHLRVPGARRPCVILCQ
jgi:hypothetical protein